ncbi:hypothetical protein PanWU01x14_273490 [Parasponia andersonii]|uniref:Uncharacterized protein n=1 Tax=Parasponia andersonii TaxID=3476 RepID=A0A2P5B411_PARAD|nr:hypothetical protein PanWU01x14_273490 [Parasponia andersonii]
MALKSSSAKASQGPELAKAHEKQRKMRFCTLFGREFRLQKSMSAGLQVRLVFCIL